MNLTGCRKKNITGRRPIRLYIQFRENTPNFSFFQASWETILVLRTIIRSDQGGWILATSPCVFAWVYTWDKLIKDIKRLWPIHTVQTPNMLMQNAFGVQVYGEVLYMEFYSVFSKPFINNETLLCKRL